MTNDYKLSFTDAITDVKKVARLPINSKHCYFQTRQVQHLILFVLIKQKFILIIITVTRDSQRPGLYTYFLFINAL